MIRYEIGTQENRNMTLSHDQLTLIHGNGQEFKETIGRQLITAILKRDDAEYDRLRHLLHPAVSLFMLLANSAHSYSSTTEEINNLK
jgi:hypothetical protein